MMGMRVDSFSGKERMAKHGCTKYQFETLLSIILEIDSKICWDIWYHSHMVMIK